MSVTDYVSMLKQLLPQGTAWDLSKLENLVKLVEVRAEGYDNFEERVRKVVEEFIPDTTSEMLPDWESVCGLPDPLLGNEEQTEAERRAAVLAKLIASGSLSIPFLIDLAANYGYEIEIEEFFEATGFECGPAECGVAFAASEGFQFVFNVISTSLFAIGCECGTAECGTSYCGDEYALTNLQVAIEKHKPAHTIAGYNLFSS